MSASSDCGHLEHRHRHLIFVFLFQNSLPILRERSPELLAGRTWSPTHGEGQFGMLPLILGSLYVTVGALVIAVPLGIGGAVFIAEVAPPRVREILKAAVELIAAIPSVVFGFLGLLLIGPWLARVFHLPIGQFAALGSLMLAFMALPTIVSICEDALHAVPRSVFNSSLALGATRWQTITRALLPAARSGVIAACLLGVGRAIGETMAVMMVTGNAPVIPQGLKASFPVRTMTATIAAEMGETLLHPTPYALFTIGLLLFVITFVTNTIADLSCGATKVGRAMMRCGLNPRVTENSPRSALAGHAYHPLPMVGIASRSTRRLAQPDADLLGQEGPAVGDRATIYLVLLTALIAAPLGVGAAIFLSEYARPGRLVRAIRLAIINLAGVPSVVHGLFGLALFVIRCGFGRSLIAGAATLALLVLPLVISASEEALRRSRGLREGSLAGGDQVADRAPGSAAQRGGWNLTGPIRHQPRRSGPRRSCSPPPLLAERPLSDFTGSDPRSPYQLYVMATEARGEPGPSGRRRRCWCCWCWA